MTRARQRNRERTQKIFEPVGVSLIDGLATLNRCSLQDYLDAASAYVGTSSTLNAKQKKAAQIRLSNALGRALVEELCERLPELEDAVVGERTVAGALRSAKADVSEIHATDGLRLAIELKPVNLAVGRAIWNRFGDIRTFAVNIHLKFPFCVVGGVLAIPTYEEVGTKEAKEALQEEVVADASADEPASRASTQASDRGHAGRRSTVHLIERAVARLIRAGGRKTEGDAPHLLEAIAVIVYDPDTAILRSDIPAPASGLRWDEFIESLAVAYRGRFEP
jgi:hypothetical protein